ncbi:MAG: hypothetical protein ABSE72_08860 [Bacteroidales bacterium]
MKTLILISFIISCVTYSSFSQNIYDFPKNLNNFTFDMMYSISGLW